MLKNQIFVVCAVLGSTLFLPASAFADPPISAGYAACLKKIAEANGSAFDLAARGYHTALEGTSTANDKFVVIRGKHDVAKSDVPNNEKVAGSKRDGFFLINDQGDSFFVPRPYGIDKKKDSNFCYELESPFAKGSKIFLRHYAQAPKSELKEKNGTDVLGADCGDQVEIVNKKTNKPIMATIVAKELSWGPINVTSDGSFETALRTYTASVLDSEYLANSPGKACTNDNKKVLAAIDACKGEFQQNGDIKNVWPLFRKLAKGDKAKLVDNGHPNMRTAKYYLPNPNQSFLSQGCSANPAGGMKSGKKVNMKSGHGINMNPATDGGSLE